MHDPIAFIRANTAPIAPPLVPEITLNLATESLPIWQKTEEELGQMNVPPPYWAFAWAGGQALARYVLDNPTLVTAKRVLDVGAGSGLGAIAAMRAGASSAMAADIDRLALAAIALNATANAVRVETTARDLLAEPAGSSNAGPFDVWLVGDLFYERQLADHVLSAIRAARAHDIVVLIGDPRRNYFPRDAFTQVAEYQVPVTRELEDAEIKRTAVWRAP